MALFIVVSAAVLLLAWVRPAHGTVGGGGRVTPEIVENVDRWRQIVEREAKRPGLRDSLVLGQIAKESAGDPNAVGPDGERGLMQMSLAAWQDYRAETNDPDSPDFDSMFIPSINIRAGSFTLSRRIEEMGSEYDGLRAYNCGITGARRNPNCGSEYARWIQATGEPAFKRYA